VFGLVRPRMAGLIHTFLSPQVIPLIFSELRTVYEGPVVQTQDLTVFNVTGEAVVARQAGRRPTPADRGRAARGLHPRPAHASRLVGRRTHPTRRHPRAGRRPAGVLTGA
jgi:hypothetical protein